MPTHANVYDTLLGGQHSRPSELACVSLRLMELLDPMEGTDVASAFSQLRAAKGFAVELDSFLDYQLSKDLYPLTRAVKALCEGDPLPLLVHVDETNKESEPLVRLLLESIYGMERGEAGTELLVELGCRPAHSALIEAALTAVQTYDVWGRDISPSFLRFFREVRDYKVIRYSALAVLPIVESSFTPIEEELYFTLALDGMEFHDAAEAALALV